MFQQTPRADGAGKGSVFYQATAALGGALGILVAILITPQVFSVTRPPLHAYLTKVYFTETWGGDLVIGLVYVVGFLEGWIIYITVKLVFTSFVIWGMAALAARRFPGA